MNVNFQVRKFQRWFQLRTSNMKEQLCYSTTYHTRWFCFKKTFFFIWQRNYKEKKRERERSCICWFAPQLSPMVAFNDLMPGAMKFYNISSLSAMGQGLDSFLAIFPSHLQVIGSALEILGLQPAVIWDAVTTDSGLASWAAMLFPLVNVYINYIYSSSEMA